MPSLSSYINVFNTCLVLLERRGFKLSYIESDDHWTAEKAGFSFLADNPIELLGLCSIYEELSPSEPAEYWWRIDQPDLLGTLMPG